MNRQVYYELSVAGLCLRCGCSFPDAPRYFGDFLAGPFDGSPAVCCTEADVVQWEKQISPWNAAAEANALSFRVSDALMEQNRFVFHAVALSRQGKAWLISGRPGVGKSTQAEFLRTEHPGEFAYICGDRPVLEQCADGSFLVHPSPWNGKEDRCGAPAAPLAGIIFLQRGEENAVAPITPREAAVFGFYGVLQTADSVERIELAARCVDSLLRAVPLWRLTSYMVPDSTHLLYDAVFAEGGQL